MMVCYSVKRLKMYSFKTMTLINIKKKIRIPLKSVYESQIIQNKYMWVSLSTLHFYMFCKTYLKYMCSIFPMVFCL